MTLPPRLPPPRLPLPPIRPGLPVGPVGPIGLRPPMPMPGGPGLPPGGLPMNMPGPGAMRLPTSVIGGPTPVGPPNPLAGLIPQGPPPGTLGPMMGGPPPGPPPPAPAPPPPPTIYELMGEADDRALAESLIDQMMGRQKDGPVYPPWYQRPRKPDIGQITQWAEDDKLRWKTRNETIADDLAVMRGEKPMGFPEDAERWWYEPFLSDDLMNQSEQATDIISSMPRAITIPFADPSQQDEAQDCDDACHWFWKEIDARYSNGGSGSRRRDKAWYAINTGWTAERLTPNPLDPTFPLEYALLNPMTVYPTWDGPRGLQRVTRVYRQTVAAVIGDYDGGKGTVRKKLMAAVRGATYAQISDGDCLTQVVEVTEYWDTWWRAVIVDGEAILPVTAHEYGRVPFRVLACGKGDPLSAGDALGTNGQSRWTLNGIARSDPGQQYQSTSLIRSQKRRHQQQMAVMGKLYTALRHADNPAMTYIQGPYGTEEQPELSNEPGAVNPLEPGASIAPYNPQISPEVVAPVMAILQRDANAAGMAQSMTGNMDKSNVTGVAVDMLNEAGTRKLLAPINGVDRGDAGLLEDFLRIVRDWGHLLGPDGKRGGIIVPRQKRRKAGPGKAPPAFSLTPTVVKTLFGDGDPRVEVESISLSSQQMMQELTMANMAKSSGITSMQFFAKRIGIQDWAEEQRRISEEKALTMPEVEKILMYKALMESDTLRPYAEVFRRYALDKPSENDPGNAGPDGAPMPSGGPGGPGGGPSGPGPTGGMSLPMMGVPSGQMGGRPPMGPGPMGAGPMGL